MKKKTKHPHVQQTKTIFEQVRIQPTQTLSTKIQAVILFFFAFLLYVNTLWFGYTLDDLLMISGNTFTKEGFAGIKKILYNDAFVGFFGENKKIGRAHV